MRRARITYRGAFHHAMNRGHDGLKYLEIKKILIFSDVKVSSMGKFYQRAKERINPKK
jgi:hypothetical protein